MSRVSYRIYPIYYNQPIHKNIQCLKNISCSNCFIIQIYSNMLILKCIITKKLSKDLIKCLIYIININILFCMKLILSYHNHETKQSYLKCIKEREKENCRNSISLVISLFMYFFCCSCES